MLQALLLLTIYVLFTKLVLPGYQAVPNIDHKCLLLLTTESINSFSNHNIIRLKFWFKVNSTLNSGNEMPGIEFNFEENPVGTHYLCTICKLLLRSPVQTECGHRCCQSCVKEKKGSSDSFVCPEDGALVTAVYPDRFVEREVSNLAITCMNKRFGCEWHGMVKEYEEHLKGCLYQKVPCPNADCGVICRRRDLKKHLETECKFKSVTCKTCGALVTQNLIKKHQQTDCPGVKIKCNQCGKDVVRAQLQSHRDSECDESLSTCPFTKIGCAAKKPMKKSDRRNHMEKASVNHITYILNHSYDLEEKILGLQEELTALKKNGVSSEMKDIAGSADSQIYANFPDANFTPLLKSKVESDSAPFMDEFPSASKFERQASKATKWSEADVQSQKVKEDDVIISDLNSTVTALRLAVDDCQKLVQGMVKDVDDTNRRVDAVRDLLRKSDSRINSLELSQQMKDVNLVEQTERLGFLEDASYSGTLIWPLSSFMKQRHDSIVGKNVSIYSPYFYTSKYGYKMRLRVYLNGDGIGKGSHISLFFVVCKGRYDALLPWPFKQKVVMTIVDQDRVKDVSDSFRPDPSSSSFQKPKNPMNIASGCPLFMPISLLDTHAYIRDDTLYIKADVDLTGLHP